MPALGSPFVRAMRQRADAHLARIASPSDDVRPHPNDASDPRIGIAAMSGRRWSRRAFLKGSAGTGAALAAASLGVRAAPAAAGGPANVVVVGAGLAGLACAHRLTQHGVAATVFEARERLGGRCWTLRDFFDRGQTAEHHGQYIDSRHRQLLRLADELGIDLVDTRAQSFPSGSRGFTWIDGRDRDPDRVFADFGLFLDRLTRDYERVGSYLCHEAGPAAVAIDRTTMREWFADNLPGGARSLLAQALSIFMTSFFGLDVADMSAINLFEAFVAPYPGADERYRLAGGNDRLVSALAERLPPGSIRRGRPLEALWSRSDGRIGARFAGEASDVEADRVVLTLPFTALREADISGLALSRRKRRAIETLAMGTNVKLNLQLNRTFAALDWNADFASDEPHYVTWDSTYGQTAPAPRTPVLTIYNGGHDGASYPTARGHGPASDRVVRNTLANLGRGIEEIADAYNGLAYLDSPVDDPWVRGSYAGFGPGQYTDFWGCLGDREGPVHFAGEHTSTHSQGYLNGAVESGQRAAREVLQAIT
jgi:monoamine oxidase